MRWCLFCLFGLGLWTAWVQAQEPRSPQPAVADESVTNDERKTDDDRETDDEQDADGEQQEPAAIPLREPGEKELMGKVSYLFGINIARSIKDDAVDVDMRMLVEGIEDGLAGQNDLSNDDMQAVMIAFNEMRARKQATAGARNKQLGEEFLAQNRKKKGVQSLPSGLQYRVLEKGRGPSPKAGDQVVVHYRGTLVDGTEFDSSYKRGEAAPIALSDVIPGWQEALQLMKVGDKWEVVVPAKLAYGAQSRPPVIGPNSTLVFQIELLEIQDR